MGENCCKNLLVLIKLQKCFTDQCIHPLNVDDQYIDQFNSLLIYIYQCSKVNPLILRINVMINILIDYINVKINTYD